MGIWQSEIGSGSASASSVVVVENSLAVSGDSRLAFGLGNDPDGDPNGYGSCSQIMWENDRLASLGRVGFDLITNASQGGETFASAVNSGRWAKALNSPAKTCKMMFMHNDINPGGIVDQAVEAFLTEYESKLIEMMATKDLVQVYSGTPLVSAAQAAFAETWYRIPVVNTGLRQLCAKYPKAMYIDQYDCVLDKTSNTLDAITGTIQTDDGVHLTTKGAQIMGHSAADQEAERIVLIRHKTKGANLLPAWTGTGGTKNNTFVCTTAANLPAGWEMRLDSGPTTASVAISIVDGSIRRLVFANTGGTDAKFQVRVDAATRTALAAAIALNETIQPCFGFQLFGNLGCNLGGFARINTNNLYVSLMGGKSSNEETLIVPTVGVSGVRLGIPMRVKVAPTSVEFNIEITVPANTGAGTLDIWNPELYKLT